MIAGRRLFHSSLGRQLKAYLEFRQALGYTSFLNSHAAKDLDGYLLFRCVSSVRELDESLVANWMHSLPTQAAATKNGKLRFARGFLSYLVHTGALPDNPALRIPYLRQKVYKPHIYTLQEIHQILEAARSLQRRYPNRLTGWTMETFVLLLYACGLRLGEAINLRIEDVDFEQGLLSLWKTKFHKERLAPFSPVVGQKLRAYLACRNRARLPAGPLDPFFAHPGGKYSKHSMFERFRLLLVHAGLAKPRGRGGPRIHDLRHYSACLIIPR